MNGMRIMRGDQYHIDFDIRDEDGKVRPADVAEIEFVIDSIIKHYPDDADYDSEDGVYQVYLTQEETFSLRSKVVPCQLRIKFAGSADIVGVRLGCIEIVDSFSKAVL